MKLIENSQPLKRSLYPSQRGQAMSEFVILLTVLMVMAAGMIYVSRLLTFQYVAREEARFFTFQQTWSAKMGDVVPGATVLNTLEKGAPDYVRETVPNRSSAVQGNLQSIIARNDKPGMSSKSYESSSDSIYLAGGDKSIWERKTSDWYDHLKDLIVATAYARNRDINPGDSWEVSPKRESDIEAGFISMLEHGGFGETFCNSTVELLKDYGFKAELSQFGTEHCAKDYNTLFGLYLARNIDFRNLFAHYGKLLDANKSPAEALQMVGTREIRNQFYSLFDKKLKKAMKDSMLFLVEGAESDTNMVTGDFSSLLGKTKYKGGKTAVQAIWDFIGPVHNNSSQRNVEAEKQREIIRDQILHADVLTDGNWGPQSFNISNAFAPIPADFTKVQALLFDGVMKNVLNREPGLVGSWIRDTNIETVVSYPPNKGFFSYLIGRFALVNKPLSAKYFLFDQPWFIPRQIKKSSWSGSSYSYRQLGNEDDEMSSETEEGMMRRRIFGLWLVPSDANAMFSPLGKLPGGDVSDVVAAGGEVLNAPGFVKDQLATLLSGEGLPMLSNLISAVKSIPEIFSFDFTPPVLPAVRPQAYPGSKELTGDNLMGSGTNRTMLDYKNEQISHINNNP